MSQTKAQLIDTLVASLLPASDSAVDIGSNAVRFANIYGDTLYGNGANLTGINTDLVADTSPQLGGNLDVNTKNILFGDSSDGASDDVLIFGAGSDLKIYHDGSNSRIVESGTGSLVIQTTRLNVANAADSEGMLQAYQDGAVELYYDNSKKFETTSIGWKSEDSVKGIFGTGGDAQIFHNGSNFFIKKISAGTGNFYLDSEGSSDLYLRNGDGGTGTNIAIRCYSNAGVDLRYQSNKKFETTSAGVTTTGNTSTTGAFISTQTGGGVLSDNLSLVDNKKVKLGASDDLQIYHDGSHSYIADTGTGNLNITASTVNINNAANSENIARFIQDGAVELYYDNSKKFETLSSGISVTGEVRPTSHLVMNAADNQIIYLGAGNDLQIYHDGNHNLLLCNNSLLIKNSSNSESMIRATVNGNVELYYDNSLKLATKTEGVRVTGNFEAYPSSSSSVTAGTFYNNSTGANADCKVLIKTYANQGADPYIKFDSGGSNMIVGQLYAGTTNNKLVLGAGESPSGGVAGLQIDGGGQITPDVNNARDLGSTSLRFRNIYTNDLNLSNEGSSNDVDGTWGSYTIQEGAEDLFLVNKRSGKKYKFNLTEVS